MEQNKLMLQYLTNVNFDALRRDELGTPVYEIKERADLTSLKEQIKSQMYQGRTLNFMPTVSTFYTYTFNIQRPAYVTASPFGKNFYPIQQFDTGITVTFKILDDIGLGLQKQYIKLGQMATEKNLLYKKLEQKKDEQFYRESLQIAKAKIQSSEASLKSSIISFQNIKKKYDAQLTNFTSYLQALSTKFDAETTYWHTEECLRNGMYHIQLKYKNNGNNSTQIFW